MRELEWLNSLAKNLLGHIDNVVLVSILIISAMLLIAMIGIKMNPDVTHNIDKVVTIETHKGANIR
jgi:hypothetical protein